jgi:hypothetical protein
VFRQQAGGVEFLDGFQESVCGGLAMVRHGGVEVHLDGLHDLQGAIDIAMPQKPFECDQNLWKAG